MDLFFGVILAVLATVFAVIKWSGGADSEAKGPEVVLDSAKQKSILSEITNTTLAEHRGVGISEDIQATESGVITSIPEDSVLKRHFVTHVLHMLETVSSPRPTDSVLSRHYDQMMDAELSACLEDFARISGLVLQYDQAKQLA